MTLPPTVPTTPTAPGVPAARVVVVGAGLGGLTLARVLQRHGIEVLVLEREASRSVRPQGGMLDLHPLTGQWALERADLGAGFRAIARAEGQDLRLLDPAGRLLLRQDTPDDAPLDRPEVDRRELRDLLLDSLPADTVRWGSEVRSATALPDGQCAVDLADGARLAGDLLVGADGAGSRVRPLLTDVQPTSLGTTSVELWIPDADRTDSDLAEMVGRGSYWILGDAQSLTAQRHGDGRIGVYLSVPTEVFEGAAVPVDEPDRARPLLAALYAGWSPHARRLIGACRGSVVARHLGALPVGLTWDPVPGVTLLGDAAHLMPPVGQGANQAMRDGAELALAVAGSPDDLAAAVTRYEPAMWARTREAAEDSARIMGLLQSPGAAERMLAVVGPGSPAGTS